MPRTPQEMREAIVRNLPAKTAKGALRPLFEQLRSRIEQLGADVVAEPRQTYVVFSHRRQFALVQPSTSSRLDVGLVLPNLPAGGRLQAAGSFGSGRITHRVAVTSAAEIDEELLGWLRGAYEGAG